MQGLRRAWIVLSCVVLAAAPAIGAPTMVAPHRYIVQRNSSPVSALSAEQVRYATVRGNENFDVVVPDDYVAEVSRSTRLGREVLDLEKVSRDCAEIKKDSTVSSCEPDVWERLALVPNDPSFGLQWHLNDASSDADISAAVAWDQATGASSVLVGVLDTGIYKSHPDLSPNLWTNPNDPPDGIDNDSNGYIDDTHGINSALNTSDPEDVDGHGTHVSGIIAACGNNGTGVSGVMWSASLVVVSAAKNNSGELLRSDTIEGFQYFRALKAAGHNIRVINASFGGYSYSDGMYEALSALNQVDVLVVAAAGNEDNNNDLKHSYPADYDLPNVISVGATGPTKQITGYSNFGNSVDIAAPGGDSNVGGASGPIYSTFSTSVPGGSLYAYAEGTSMAAPVVAGAIGLLASKRPSLTGAELKSILLSTADLLPQLNGFVNSGRFINVGKMIAYEGPIDNCPDDPSKTAPGSCGCGISDADSDADGSADCVDGCPADVGKTSAGICGCGVSDIDANNNSTPDCRDPVLKGVVPLPPKLKATKGKVVVSMEGRSGVLYLVKVTTKVGKGKAKTSFYSSSAPSYTIRGLKGKTSVSVSYSYYLAGTPVVSSSYSSVKKISSK